MPVPPLRAMRLNGMSHSRSVAANERGIAIQFSRFALVVLYLKMFKHESEARHRRSIFGSSYADGSSCPPMLARQTSPVLRSIVLITESILPLNTCLARLRVKPVTA